ncbi:Zinc knuckle CX2CX4HX4C [Artemisia annua]|uniref:Zinc knuckle CX2CX4HX4C n=1 Tax=Artemisia annua TaxID=35608 RepID=A0A2U1LQ55_ARTAN|nr:Zinc knuckle CX2CX4HX4C [Artemisia annua]
MDSSDSLNPNFVDPQIGVNEEAKSKRTTRSQLGAMKNKQAKGNNTSAHVNFRQGTQKMGSKGSKNSKGNVGSDGGENNSGIGEGFEEGLEGDVGSSVDAHSLESRSVGDPESEKDIEGMVSKTKNILNNANVEIRSEVSDGKNACSSINIGDIHVPVSDNPTLSTRNNPSGSPRILKRGEVLKQKGNNASADFSFNNVEKWPSLSESSKGNSPSQRIEGAVEGSNVENTKVNESMNKEMGNTAKSVSFASAVQGMSLNGANFARVLVEIDAQKGLMESIDVCYKSLGKSMKLKVEYPWKPPICSTCKVFGHGDENCSKIVPTEAAKVQGKDKVNVSTNYGNVKEGRGDDWKTVDHRKNVRSTGVNAGTNVDNNVQRGVGSNAYLQRGYTGETSYSRGGFSGRERGNTYGRGYNSQRYTRNDNQNVSSRYATEASTVNGANLKVNGQASNSHNRYAALVNDQENEGVEDMEVVKIRIDEICGKGDIVGESEREMWTTEEKDYYMVRVQESIMNMNVDSLKVSIEKLEKQISYSNRNIAMSSKSKADSMVKAIMVERGLTENQATLIKQHFDQAVL